MKRIFFNTISLLIAFIAITACTSSQRSIGSYYTSEVECLESELDGSETVLVWGFGKNRVGAIEQAKKNAVRTILFKGITSGKSDCSIKPLILEVNAEEKHQQYFNTFFKDNGAYKQYVSMKDSKRSSIQKSTNDREKKYGIIVRVLRSELKEKLISDNIINPR